MVHFLVQLHSDADRKVAKRRLRRSAPDEVERHLEGLKRAASACSKRIRPLLPPGAELIVLETVGGIIIGLPSGDGASALQERIRAVCGDVIAGFRSDAEIELLRSAESSLGT